MQVPFLSIFLCAAVTANANHMLDDSWRSYGSLQPRPTVGYSTRGDWPLSHASHSLSNPASSGIPAVSGNLPAREECWFKGAPRLRGPTYADDSFWNRGSHNLRAPRFKEMNRVVAPQFGRAYDVHTRYDSDCGCGGGYDGYGFGGYGNFGHDYGRY